MKNWTKRVAPWGGLVPAAAVIACMQITLSGYTAPVFEVQKPEETETVHTEETAEERETKEAVKEEETKAEPESKAEDAEAYKDGTYYGTGNGYRGAVKVAVTVEDGKIKEISVVQSADDEAFFGKARALLSQMIEKQSTDVDTVSGATYSSAGLIGAVRNALKEAGMKVEGENISLPAAPKQQEPAEGAAKTLEKAKDPSKFKNGTYYGTGTGFSGTIKVKVVIKKGKIKNITVVESSDDAAYFSRAKILLDRMVKKQGTDVDTVSGATYSSTGLINAVRDALKDAAQTEKKSSQKKDKKKKNKKNKKNKTQESEKTPETEAVVTPGTLPYKDGVYYGTGEGYRGDITVAVTIANKTIQDIRITAAEDDEAFLSRAKTILEQVKNRQSSDVDTVSGATFSSRGILEAINNALLEAKKAAEGYAGEGKDQTEKETEETESGTEKETGETESGTEQESETQTETETQQYADGIYRAEASCVPDAAGDFTAYTLAASVTITDGKVTAVTDILGTGEFYEEGNDWYISRAANGTKKYPGVVGQMTEKGSAEEIDAVSGATCSSRAIISAVKKAFEMAKAGERK